jgi:hypothetical protein
VQRKVALLSWRQRFTGSDLIGHSFPKFSAILGVVVQVVHDTGKRIGERREERGEEERGGGVEAKWKRENTTHHTARHFLQPTKAQSPASLSLAVIHFVAPHNEEHHSS